MIQIVILAGIALFLVLQLRKVLGTRDGFEPPKGVEPATRPRESGRAPEFDVIDGGGVDHDIADFVDPDSEMGKALTEMKKAEPGFFVSPSSRAVRDRPMK